MNNISQIKENLDLKNKVSDTFALKNDRIRVNVNPFLNKNGNLVNPYLNYQKLLNNGNVSDKAKDFIRQATGILENDSSKKITDTTQNSNNKGTTKSRNAIVEAGQKYIGIPYVWGGESLSEGGMDCSGFVYNALHDAGYNIARTTAQGYRGYGTQVSKANMQPGDLVFYGKNGNAEHVGIYIGNGQMMHSSGGSKNTVQNPGKGVSVTNVDYRSDFLEARRY